MQGLIRAALTAAAVVAATSLAACGGSDGGEVKPNGFTGKGPITYVAGKDSTGVVQRQIESWNSGHPAEKVTLIELPSDADAQRQQLIQNAQTKSDTYSVVNLDVVWTSEFAANRWIDELPADQFPLGSMLAPAVDSAKYRGKLYAVPTTVGGGLLYYRKDLLTKAGITTAPATLADIDASCAKVRALPEAAGIGCYAGQFEKYEGLTVNFSEMAGAGKGHVTNTDGKPDVDTAAAKAGVNWLVNAVRTGVVPKEAITYKEEEGRQAFQAGKLLFHRQWPYQYSLANKTDGSSKVAGRFDVAPLPGVDGPGASTLGGNSLAIATHAKNKGTALEFVKWFSNRDNARANLKVTSNTPAYTDLYDDPEMIKLYPYLPALKQSLLNAVPRPKVVRYGDVTAAIQDRAYAMITGRSSVDDGLAGLQSDLVRLTAS